MGFIVMGIFLFVSSIMFITAGIGEKCNIKNYILKTEVVNTFKDVDWSTQVFRVNDTNLKDSKDRTTFYASEDIDKAIKKLNEKLNP